MTDTRDNLTDFEQALAELDRAERAGVFRPTPLVTKALLDAEGDAETPWIYRHRRIVAAAAIVLAAGVWVTMFAVQLDDVRRAKLAGAGQPGDSRTIMPIQHCIAGPNEVLAAACVAFDTDADGDVDLADLSSFQLACN